MKHMKIIVSILVLICLFLNVQFVTGQEATPGVSADNGTTPASVLANVPGALPIQGRLTDANGVPLNGSYAIRFSLYEVETGGTPLCTQSRTVPVTNGLFSSYLDNCYFQGPDGPGYLDGQKVWLGITVGSDSEMTPRQVILPVPYALTLSPGAYVKGTVNKDGILMVENTIGAGTTADWDALIAKAVGGGEAVEATSENGFAIYGNSTGNFSIYGTSPITNSVPTILGCKGDCSSFGDTPAGVEGVSTAGDGIVGISDNLSYRGVYAVNAAGGTAIVANSNSNASETHQYPTLYLLQGNSSGDFIVGASSLWGTRYFRVDRTGKGFFNGGTQAGGADFAEQVAVEAAATGYEPGDVLVISAHSDRSAELSYEPFSSLVFGVYSTNPGYLAGALDSDDPLNGIPVAVVGIVPCKVSAENGSIQRGDLLVTSSTPGHAMRAGKNPPAGTILGKAMEPLAEGTGLIEILVTLQ